MTKLTPREKAFIDAYLIKQVGAEAAIKAGYSPRGAAQAAHKILSRPHVLAAIQKAMDARAVRTQIDQDYVLRQAVKIHERCMQESKPEIDPATGKQMVDDDGNKVYRFDANGAARSLELVGKHVTIQAFRDKMALEGGDGGPIQVIVKKFAPSDD